MNVLVDTSIWADHFRKANAHLLELLTDERVLIHPFVIGELAMGNLRDRHRTASALNALSSVAIVDETTWLDFVETNSLGGSGLGFVDAHLLAAAAVSEAQLWTRDRRLANFAKTLGCSWEV